MSPRLNQSLIALLLLSAPNTFAQNPTTWSKPSNGLRLGLHLENSATTGNLRITLENISPSDLLVLLGANSSYMSWDFQFLASNQKTGERYQIYEYETKPEQDVLEPIHFRAGGLVLPVLLRLPAGHRREFLFPFEHLHCINRGKRLALDTLLRKGFILSVALKVEQQNLEGAEMNNLQPPPKGHQWTGQINATIGWPDTETRKN
jgi:hypothetical protein